MGPPFRRIEINGNILLQPPPLSPSAGVPPRNSSKYILVQTSSPLSDEQEDGLNEAGASIHQYVSENTYLCGYTKDNFEPVRRLSFVQWTFDYLQFFVIDDSLKPLDSLSRAPHTIAIVMHEDVNWRNFPLHEISTKGNIPADSIKKGRNKVEVIVAEGFLDDLASIDQVQRIFEVRPLVLANNVARIGSARDTVSIV